MPERGLQRATGGRRGAARAAPPPTGSTGPRPAGRAPARAGRGGLGPHRATGWPAWTPGPGGELGERRLVRRQLAADDGGDDAAGGRADGWSRTAAGRRGRRRDRRVRGRLPGWPGSPPGSLAYAAIEAVRSLELGLPRLGLEAGRYVAAGVIAGAGLYQLTRPQGRVPAPLPRPPDVPQRALAARPPGRAADGRRARRLCVGCSWALMAALFALGVMSLTWMAVVAALIAAERLLPGAMRPAAVAVVLVALGAWCRAGARRGARPDGAWVRDGDGRAIDQAPTASAPDDRARPGRWTLPAVRCRSPT